MEIRTLDAASHPDCEAILRALPDWFGIEESIVEYVNLLPELTCLGAFDEDGLAGFLALKRHFPETAEIHVMGVRPERHRRGIGRLLVEAAVVHARGDGVRHLTVKTLSARHPDEFYARTRAFYLALGFDRLEELPELWSPGNPCLFMSKSLGP